MPETPEPLPIGFVLSDRFEIIQTLGRGGFGIVYLAKDRRLHDEAVIKELAPSGTTRSETGVLHLDSIGGHQAHHLRHRFLEEAKLLSKLNIKGLPSVRAAFGENGTAYYATEHVDGTVTLEDLLRQGHRFDPHGAMDVFYQVLEILESLHAKGFLHRDIKPSNILLAPNGEVTLIDLGAAREWHADASTHTVLFTPGYAPLEQLSPRGRRGPATDVYALCATGYHLLTGSPPPDAAERADGTSLVPIRELRRDVEPAAGSAMEAGLSLRYEDRPQSMHELRNLLSQSPIDKIPLTLAELDDLLVQLKKFAFDRRACPSCGGLLDEVKPLRKHACPVCRRGTVKNRNLNERLCPLCRTALLVRIDNRAPLAFCPLCKTGELSRRRVSFLASKQIFQCKECDAKFDSLPDGMSLASFPLKQVTWPSLEIGEVQSFDEWRAMSQRSTEVHRCDGCFAQFDTIEDARWQQVVPPDEARTLYPEEWARVAARLDPTAGNAECDHCSAEFEVDTDRVSLLSAHDDPFGFAKHYAGRLLVWEDVRWLGVGKESPGPGLVCHDCGTEFDHDGEYERLIRTENPKLIRQIDEPKTAEDWHRIARGLPEVRDEQEFIATLDDSVVHAYMGGEIGVDSSGQLLWSGPATRMDDAWLTGNLVVRASEMTHGGMLRKWRTPMDAVVDASADGHTLILTLSGQREPIEFDVEPIELTAALKSGKRTVELGAEELAARIRNIRTVSSPERHDA
jgi:serine/threonine protein kinase